MRITSKGQVTIPMEIRDKLGLLPNTEVEFEIDRDARADEAGHPARPAVARPRARRSHARPRHSPHHHRRDHAADAGLTWAPTLVDSNVLLDIFTEDDGWFEWSAATLAEAAERGPLSINPIIYAEVSAGFERIEELDDALPSQYYRRVPLPWEAAFLAGKCFSSTGAAAGAGARRCRTSTSAPTPPSPGSRC